MISIVVPIYNAENYLTECLDSIKQQDYSDFEVLMVNDGSTDRSADICQKYEKSDIRFHLFSQNNGGGCAARNKAISKAQGSYIAFVDADDKLEKSFLGKLLQAMEKSHADVAVCDFFDEKGKEHTEWKSDYAKGKGIFNQYLKGYYCNRIMNKLYRASVVRHVMFPEERPIKEDAFWTAHVFQYCNGVVTVPEALYYYRNVEGSLSHNRKYSQELVVGAFYNDCEKYSILWSNISCELQPLFYEQFGKWVKDVMEEGYDLNLHDFWHHLRLLVLNMDKEHMNAALQIVFANSNYRNAEMIYMRNYLLNRSNTMRDKLILLLKLIKRGLIHR